MASWTTSRGIVLLLCANILFCGMACMVKSLHGINAWTISLVRFLTGVGILGLSAMSGRIRLHFVDNRGLFMRGLLGGSSTAIFFFSIVKLGLARASFIASLYPVFASFFSRFILSERLSPLKWAALVGALSGTFLLMISVNGRSGESIILFCFDRYVLLALFGSMLSGSAIVSIKKLQATDSTSAIFFAQCLIGSLIVFVPASIGTTAFITPGAMAMLLAIGIMAAGGQLLMTQSYRYVSVTSGALLVMTAPVFNCFAGLIFFHEPLTPVMIAGAVIILFSSAGSLFDKGYSVRQK